jgi:hypothetical protein
LNGIQTALSAGTNFALEQGLPNVIVAPLFVLSNPADPLSIRTTPQATDIANASTSWAQTLYALRSVPGINFIAPIIGQSFPFMSDANQLAILEAVQDHINFMSSEGQYIQGIFGEDSSSNTALASDATLQSHAQTLASRYGGTMAENIIMPSPARFIRSLPSNNTINITLGGEYFAASLAGMIGSSPVNAPLTRTIVPNWINVPDYRDYATKNADAQSGLMVIENVSGQSAVKIRHAITLDDSSFSRRAVNVVRAKFNMVQTLYEIYNNQLIGQIPADGNAPITIENITTTALQALVNNGTIVAFNNLTITLLAGLPTTAQVVFSWLPVYMLDYIQIMFSLDLSGSTSVSTVTVVST